MKCIVCKKRVDDIYPMCNRCLEEYDGRIIYTLSLGDILRELMDDMDNDKLIEILAKDDFQSLYEEIELQISSALEYFNAREYAEDAAKQIANVEQDRN